MSEVHICYSVTKDCINHDSYGMICVGCGCCSKDKTIRYPARLKMYREHLDEAKNFDQWINGWRRIQRRNMKLNITYNKRRIAIYQRLVNELYKSYFLAGAEC